VVAVIALGISVGAASNGRRAATAERIAVGTNQRLRLTQCLMVNNHPDRFFTIANYEPWRGDPPRGTVSLSATAPQLEKMTPSEASELLDVQWRIWADALVTVLGELPRGATLWVETQDSADKKLLRRYGRLVDGKFIKGEQP
jgi:hypothetical protein